MSWTIKMFVWSVTGSLAALFWPWLIAYWRYKSDEFFAWLGPPIPRAGPPRTDELPGPPLVRFLLRLALSVVQPFVEQGRKAIGIAIVALVIGAIAAAVGFLAFLNDPATQDKLRNLDSLAFFAAFNYGFSSTSLVEEALKGKRG